MKLFETKNFPSFLVHLSLKSEEISTIIEKYTLEFSQTRNSAVEWGMAFPIFLNPFYKFIYVNKKIPTQREFWEYYVSENKAFFDASNFTTEITEGLKARLYRTYPSLIRDLHFSAYVNENFKTAEIIYNRKLDVEEGIDLMIIYEGKYWGVNLYTNTRRAFDGREKKENRHTKFDNVIYVELPVDFKGSVKCGQFFLYGENEYKQILKIINN
jgi:hypothetical protein